MMRSWWVLLATLLLALPSTAPAADGPSGNYKLTFVSQGLPRTFWLIQFGAEDGKWTGKVVATAEGVPPAATVDNVSLVGDRVRLTIKLQGQEFSFDGRLPKEKDQRILGSLALGPQMVVARLEPTQLKTLERFELNKETVARPDAGPEVFEAVNDLIAQASSRKAKPEEVRGWLEKAFKAAEPYGVRWQREIAQRSAQALVNQKEYLAEALQQARRAERLLDPKDEASVQMPVLEVLVSALKKSEKADEAKEFQTRLDKLVAAADNEYLKKMPPYKPEAFAGRKGKSERAVLVELFTGAQCPPCVAADLGFDGLGKTYKPTEVVLLQYHLHIPGPDPLTNPDTEARQEYYGRAIRGTPAIFFNGKAEAGGGGRAGESEGKYKEYREVIEPLLEDPARVKLLAAASQKGNEIKITAKVSDLDKTGERIKLRIALVEERVRYVGSNGLRFHHQVVRAFPGGADGLALLKKSADHSVSIDLEDLRKKLAKYLDDYAKKEDEFPTPERPMDLKKLRVIAFVQDDATREVLQAIQVEVKREGAE